jgi:hypothetical protein
MFQVCEDYDTFTCEGWTVNASGTGPNRIHFDVSYRGASMYSSLPIDIVREMVKAQMDVQEYEERGWRDPTRSKALGVYEKMNWALCDVLKAAVEHYTVKGRQPIMAGLGEVQ